MKKFSIIIGLLAALLIVFLADSCQDRTLDHADAELVVSLYIPETVSMRETKAETGTEDPLADETVVNTLQVWVFLHTEDENDGLLVSYKSFSEGLSSSGLPNSAITRFGLPLAPEMYKKLLQNGTRVDVYAVANLAPGSPVSLNPVSGDDLSSTTLGKTTTRSELERIVLTGDSFGVTALTTLLPDGIPMSGVLKGASVTGNYPVLNISTLSLTRAVSKIRFVFCQQANPPTSTNPDLTPFNSNCKIVSISFDGMDNGFDCGIADREYLFTTKTHSGTEDLFDVADDRYVPLDVTLGSIDNPLIINGDLTCAEYPEVYVFRSPGHEYESARQYETRLDAAISAQSQIGPVYLRETDKKITGTITYSTSSDSQITQTVPFSLGDNEYLTRNHSWTVYAFFAEETETLQLKVVVNPWDWSEQSIDYTYGSVNVIRRFTVVETPPLKFKKEEADEGNGFYDVTFWHTVTIENDDDDPVTITNNTIAGDIIIATPVGAKLCAIAVPGALPGYDLLSPFIGDEYVPIFEVTPSFATIYPNWENPESGRIEDCKISFHIRCNPRYATSTYEDQLKGQYIDLHFCVMISEDLYIDLGSESIDYYRFILDPDWNSSSNSGGGND